MVVTSFDGNVVGSCNGMYGETDGEIVIGRAEFNGR